MKIVRTMGRGARQTAELIAALEVRGGEALDAVLPAVKKIVNDVRKQGDRALLRYAAQFDGLAGANALRVAPEEMEVHCAFNATRTHNRSGTDSQLRGRTTAGILQ